MFVFNASLECCNQNTTISRPYLEKNDSKDKILKFTVNL